jgi:hypothetical protein
MVRGRDGEQGICDHGFMEASLDIEASQDVGEYS